MRAASSNTAARRRLEYVMKALVIAIALCLVIFPVTAGPMELPTNLFDQLFGWFIAVWEEMGSMSAPDGSPQEIGPVVDPWGDD